MCPNAYCRIYFSHTNLRFNTAIFQMTMSLTYCLLLIILAPVPLYIWLPYQMSYTTSLLSSLVMSGPASSHDYIVVGGGSAGSVVAARLAQAGHQVLLVEAGGPAPPLAHVPSFVGFLQNSPIDWAYRHTSVLGSPMESHGNMERH